MSLAGKLIEILYIDDEPDFAEMAATFLEREDNRLEVDTATSANEGVDRLADNKYQCIISDYDMPGENGIEFLETVRETHPDLPFILYTGKGSETVASDAISAGVTDYLQKRSGTDQYELLANRITNAVSQFRAEQQLQEEQKRCEILFDRLSQAIVDVEYCDDDPIVRRVNSTFEDTFGYDNDDVIGKSLDDYIVPEDRTDEAASINQRIQAGGVLNGEKVTRQTADGSREFFLEKSMYNDSSGGFAIYTDITERRGENPEFERSHQFLKALSTALPEYTFIYDKHGKCLDAVTGWRQDHLYANEELIGSTVDTVLNEEAARKIREAIRTALDSGKRQTVEYNIQKSSGTSQYEAYVTPLTDGYEGRPAAVLTARDITKRKEREQSFKRLYDTTCDLIQADNDEEIAEIAVEASGEILNMPITGIWLYDEDSNVLRPTAITDAGRDLLGEPPVFEPGNSLSWEAFQAQEAKLFENVASQPGRYNPETPLRSEVILPLGDHGVMNTGATDLGVFDEADRSLAQILATNIEAALTRAEQQQELTQQAEQLDLALKGAQLGVWDWNVQTDEAVFNERWAEMLGHSLDEIEPHLNAWKKRAHPEDLPDAEAALEAHFAGETEYYKCDHRMQTKSGDWIWVRDIGKVVERDNDGKPVRAVGIHQDITSDKERERRLREMLEHTQKLIRVETASEAATRAVEIADQTLSFPLSGVHLEQDDERLEPTAVTDTLREHLGFVPTYKRIGGDRRVDEVIWDVYTSGEPLVFSDIEQEHPETASETPSNSGIIHPLANHGVFITSATSAEAFNEFDQYLAELLAAVLAATLERLQQEQLIESQRDNLDLLNQMVRHDIRNDLNVVVGHLDLLAEHVDEGGADHLDIAQNSADNAIELTQTARDVTEVLLQQQTERSPEEVKSVLKHEIEDVRSSNERALVTVEGTVPTVKVLADDMLESVFRNLLSNAIIHNDKDVPEVTVSVMTTEDVARVRIADNGPGIPDEQKDQIFEEGETGIDSGGTGLGLYLVQTLVDRYEGDIWIEDNDPDGSVFVVELPTMN